MHGHRVQSPWFTSCPPPIVAVEAHAAHYPIFCTGCAGNNFLDDDGTGAEAGSCNVSASYYASDRAEYAGNCNASASAVFEAEARQAEAEAGAGAEGGTGKGKGKGKGSGLGGHSAALIGDMAPLLAKYGVDLFFAGHWHYYESLWPGRAGTAGCPACLQPLQENFTNPQGTVHVTTGNGGPPGHDSFTEHCPGADCRNISATRKQGSLYGYGRLVFHNESTVEFTQFENEKQAVVDHFFVTQEKHGAFVDA
jgi:hypothetical protein